MKRVKDFFKSKSAKLSAAAVSVGSMLTVGALAAEGDYASVTTALTSAVTELKGEAFSVLGSIAPVAIAMMGGYWLIRLGIKWFKGLSK